MMKSLNADSLRVQSLGSDSLGNVYWYFYGTRLYKEEPFPNSKQKRDWEEEWRAESNTMPIQKRGPGRPRKSDLSSEKSKSSKKNCSSFLDLDSKSRWSVVCTTLEDWKIFAKKLKDSKFKNELSLYEIITKNFLPHLSSLYKEKDKRLKRKLLEISDERPSTRLELRKQQANEMDMKEGYDTSMGDRGLPARKRGRPPKRRNKNDLVKPNVPTEPDVTSTGIESINEYKMDKKLFDKNISQAPELYRKLCEGIKIVKLHKDSWPFLKPVDEEIAPGYYDIIKDPIDLSSIERKIMLKAYNSIRQVDQDFQKLVLNCRLYNGLKSSFTDMAKTLLRVFRKHLFKVTNQEELEKQASCAETASSKSEDSNFKSKTDSRNSRHKLRVKRRKIHASKMRGLEMLAEASEQACKNVSLSETELYVAGSRSVSYKSSAFPDLKIVSLQNHPASYLEKYSSSSNSSDSESKSESDHLPSSTLHGHSSDSGKDVDLSTKKQQKHLSPNHSMNKLAHSTCSGAAKALANAQKSCRSSTVGQRSSPISPDSCNNVSSALSPGTDSSSNDQFSGNEVAPDLTRNLSEFVETFTTLDMPNESTKNDDLSSLSSIFSRIIRENQDFQMSDLANLGCAENVTEHLSSQSLQSTSTYKEVSLKKSSSDSAAENTLPPVNMPSLGGLQPLTSIMTVDASVLGLSMSNDYSSCSPANVAHGNFTLSSRSSPQYQEKDNCCTYAPDDIGHSYKCDPQILSLPYPSPPYTSSSETTRDDEKIENISNKSKSLSPDLQQSNFRCSNNLAENMLPQLCPTIMKRLSPVNKQNFNLCPMQVVNSPPGQIMSPVASPVVTSCSSGTSPELSLTRGLLNPMPLQLPLASLSLPLMPILSQASDCTNPLPPVSCSTVPFTTPQHVFKPVASLAVNSAPSVSPPRTSSAEFGSQLPKAMSLAAKSSHNAKSPSAQKGKKRKHAALRPAEPSVSPASVSETTHNGYITDYPNPSSYHIPTTTNVIFPKSTNSVPSSENKTINTDSSFTNVITTAGENTLKSYRESNLACTPAPSLPLFSPYGINGFNHATSFTTAAEKNFWNARPTYSIPVTHSAATMPLLSSVCQNSMMSNAFPVISSENRFQAICPVPAVTENSLPIQTAEKSISTMSNNALFSSYPILYTVPNSSTDVALLNAGRDSGSILANRPEFSKPTHILHGIPSRPIQDIPKISTQQLRPQQYLSVPHYMVPPRQALPPILPAPLMPSLTISGESNRHSESSGVPQTEKTTPVYTVLQNVSIKPHL